MKAIDPIIDADLDAYVDGELDVARRIQVESYLSENPAIAAKVMADLSMKGELRLALAGESAFGRAETRDAARKLERGLSYGRILHSVQRIAAVVYCSPPAGWHIIPSAPSRQRKSQLLFRHQPMSRMRCAPTARQRFVKPSRRRRHLPIAPMKSALRPQS